MARQVQPDSIFSSPEPKAHGELIVYQSSRRLSVCLSVCLCVCVFTFLNMNISEISGPIATKFYLKHHGRGKGCIRFWTRSDQNSGVHGNG